MMGLVKLPTFSDYWSNAMHYPAIASNIPRNRFKVLCQNLHFVDNSSFSKGNGKLFKFSPVIGVVRNQCLKVECKTYHAVDQQIIPSKTKYTKIRQYNPKKLCKWGFKNIVQAGKSGFMYDFYLYCGNETKTDLLPITIIYELVSNLLLGYILKHQDMLTNVYSLITGLRHLPCYSTWKTLVYMQLVPLEQIVCKVVH